MDMKTATGSQSVKQETGNSIDRDAMERLKDKIVLITGAGKGSGRLLARALAEQGVIVAANDISPIHGEEVVNQIAVEGGGAKAYIDDVPKKVAVQNINQVEDDFGPIDLLINHAAVEPGISLLNRDEWEWHRTLDVNLTGAFLMTQSVGRGMRARGGGVIINLITEAKEGGTSKSAFDASMKGLAGFTYQAAHELKPYGIQAHALESPQERIVETVFALLDLQLEER